MLGTQIIQIYNKRQGQKRVSSDNWNWRFHYTLQIGVYSGYLHESDPIYTTFPFNSKITNLDLKMPSDDKKSV